MSSKAEITLDWYQNIANVFERENGQTFEIGTVKLKTLVAVIVGCTYYHHLLPALETRGSNTFSNYRREITAHQRRLNKLLKKIKRLHQKYPEITEKNISPDTDEPQFIDLAISIRFGLPFLPTDDYESKVIEKIEIYRDLLGSDHSLELLHKEER